MKLYPDGPRCSKHKPRAQVAEIRAPVWAIRSPDDALALASFAAIAAMEGRIPPGRANAIANISREWRRAYEAGKHGAAYEAAVRVAQELINALADPSRIEPRLIPRIVPQGGALDRAIRVWLALWRTAVTPG